MIRISAAITESGLKVRYTMANLVTPGAPGNVAVLPNSMTPPILLLTT